MAKVWCAQIECEHNKGNRCRATEINLSVGNLHTIHQGFEQVWYCRSYQMSDEAKRQYDAVKQFLEESEALLYEAD